MDFVHDQLATGTKLRVLTVVDTFSRYVPVLDPRFSYRGEDVGGRSEWVCSRIGYPRTIRVDSGSEFISRDLDLWAYANGRHARPGEPTDNAYIEAFNGRCRAECLNAHWFLTLAAAAEKMDAWRNDYNEGRPHGAIGHKGADLVDQSRRHHQPADVIIAGKPNLPAVQRSVSDQQPQGVFLKTGGNLGLRSVRPAGPVLGAVDHVWTPASASKAVEEALSRHGKPELFNTDQGSKFTSMVFTSMLRNNGIAISMDGRGSWGDNVFVERLWGSIKYEEVYLRACDTTFEARASIGRYTPDVAYFNALMPIPAAA